MNGKEFINTVANEKKAVRSGSAGKTNERTSLDEAKTSDVLADELVSKLKRYYGVSPSEANEEQMYKAVVLTVKDQLMRYRAETHNKVKETKAKRVYYMCMEFLIGRSLKNNICNLGLEGEYKKLLADYGFELDSIYEHESDAALGNGGLGRLAACYMDSLTTSGYPATGFSLCYEYGLFKQRIVEGTQVELPDVWLPEGEAWLVPRTDKAYTVRFGGQIKEVWEHGALHIVYENAEEIRAVPYDMMISGANTDICNYLRLWRAYNVTKFNMSLFSQGQYMKALEENNNAEILTKVLYPSDNHDEGKLLRLNQQYFLCSASLQSIIADHLAAYGTLENFADKVAIHLNDTHPAMCIPELMRILMDIYSYSWEAAWAVTVRVFSYTNHTVMPEALEQWNEELFRLRLPRIHSIICEINRRFCAELWNLYPGDWQRISDMAIIANRSVRMANLSVVGSHTVNGVSELHSEILKNDVFHDFSVKDPEKFINVTNGITHRRWLVNSNPELTALLDECIGTEYRYHPEQLEGFLKYENDASVLKRLEEIKYNNKVKFANYVAKREGIVLDPNSVFDVQAKRLHEYKRQLLNALRIISLYNALCEDPELPIRPQTFIFGAKAAPGYDMAKQIIRLIWSLSQEIDRNPLVRQKLRVVFMEDYNVSMAEKMIPAADISEQISLAGKEASGTGNMKFMINGAITCGTLDGANVEMKKVLGDENIYIFGLNAKEVEDLWKRGYHASDHYRTDPRIRAAVDRLSVGFNGVSFAELMHYLIIGYGVADPYMCLADFGAYCDAHERMLEAYDDRNKWNKMALNNIARAGFFASDRAVREYADGIWHMKPLENTKR